MARASISSRLFGGEVVQPGHDHLCCTQNSLMHAAVGVGNMPDRPQQGWLPWLRQQRKKGLQVSLH